MQEGGFKVEPSINESYITDKEIVLKLFNPDGTTYDKTYQIRDIDFFGKMVHVPVVWASKPIYYDEIHVHKYFAFRSSIPEILENYKDIKDELYPKYIYVQSEIDCGEILPDDLREPKGVALVCGNKRTGEELIILSIDGYIEEYHNILDTV